MKSTLKYKFPRNSAIGGLFLLAFGCYMMIKTDPVVFTDSPRYYAGYGNPQSLWDEIINHTGRNIQTLLFTVSSKFFSSSASGALIANLMFWFISGVTLLYFLETKIKNARVRFLAMTLAVLTLTSNLISSWIAAVLTESIALSLLIFIIFISALTILDEIEIADSKNWLSTSVVLLFMAQPIWAMLSLPIVLFAYSNLKKYKIHLFLIGLTAIFSMTIATFSHRLPYENTGLTFKGFESLTRAYFYSLPNRFEEVAYGETIRNCKPAFDLLQISQTQGTPTPLFFGFKDATASCPEVVKDLNDGKSNSILKMVLNDPANTVRMAIIGIYAISNQQIYASDSISSRPLGKLTGDLIVPIGLFLIPVSIFLLRDKKQSLLLTLSNLSTLGGGLLLYLQIGIEGERKTLPAAVMLSLTAWIIIIHHFRDAKITN